MENKVTDNSLHQYFTEMGKYEVLSPEDELACARAMVNFYDELTDEVLKLPSVWWSIYNKWKRLKRLGKSSNKMTEEYGNPKFDADKLTLQVDANIEGAVSFFKDKSYDKEAKKKVAYLFKAAGLSKTIYLSLVDELLSKTNNPYLDADKKERIQYLREKVKEYHHKLVTANLRLVINFAKNFKGYGIPLADLIQEGNIGLMRAAEKFDPSRELKFSTYAAWWIRQSFIKVLKRQGKTIRLPSHIHDAMNKLKKTNERLYSELNREPSPAELAAASNLETDLVERLLDLRSEPLSLETPVARLTYRSESKSKHLKDFLFDDNLDPMEEFNNSQREKKIAAALQKHLTKSEQSVIILRFGLGGNNSHTLEEIADLANLSRERIRQLERSAIEKLKENASYLKEFEDE